MHRSPTLRTLGVFSRTNAEEVSLRGLMSIMMDPFGLHSPLAVKQDVTVGGLGQLSTVKDKGKVNEVMA